MRKTLERFIDERLIITVILINTVVIFLRGFPTLREQFTGLLFFIDYFCTLYFVLEMAAKTRVYGWGGYFDNGWNVFEFIIVVVSVPMLVSPWVEVRDFSMILVLRSARLLRAFRLLRFVPDSERLWSGAKRGLRASLGVLLALALYNFALGLCACYFFGDLAPAHFGDPLISVYSMFKVFTVEGWFDIPDAIAHGSTPMVALLVRAFFIFAVSTGGILGLSMANAVFVDEMVMDNNRILEENVRDIKEQVEVLTTQNEKLLASVLALSSRPGFGAGDDGAAEVPQS